MEPTKTMLSLNTENITDLPKSGIYIIECIKNNKFYIGSCQSNSKNSNSKNGFYRRWFHHISCLQRNKHSNPHLQAMWNKYGQTSFKFSIIEIIENKNIILEKEQYYLDKYYNNKNCININKFATTTSDIIKNKEGYKKLSLLYKGKTRDRKIFESQSKPILQYSLNGNFIREHESIGLAATNSNTNRQDIHKVLSNKIISAGGFIWKYKTENYSLKIKSKDEIIKENKELKDSGR